MARKHRESTARSRGREDISNKTKKDNNNKNVVATVKDILKLYRITERERFRLINNVKVLAYCHL